MENFLSKETNAQTLRKPSHGFFDANAKPKPRQLRRLVRWRRQHDHGLPVGLRRLERRAQLRETRLARGSSDAHRGAGARRRRFRTMRRGRGQKGILALRFQWKLCLFSLGELCASLLGGPFHLREHPASGFELQSALLLTRDVTDEAFVIIAVNTGRALHHDRAVLPPPSFDDKVGEDNHEKEPNHRTGDDERGGVVFQKT